MKKLLFLFSLAVLTCGAYAQENSGYTISAFNSFTAQGSAAPTYFTKVDTVTNTGVDSFGTALEPYRNSVGFQFDVKKISGNTNSAYIQLWGSKEASQTTGGYSLISTDTIRNVSAMQVFNHDIGSVVNTISTGGAISATNTGYGGNNFRWYFMTISGVSSSSLSWNAISYIR